MLRSGNDCAVALALDTSGGIEEFAKLMNGIASKLKLTNSHFVNPHGLPEIIIIQVPTTWQSLPHMRLKIKNFPK